MTREKSALSGATSHSGGCHCGAVRFDVELGASPSAGRCNCSVCAKIGQTGAIVKPNAFTLHAGESNLGRYEWGAKISSRFFCKTCGIHCFARGHLAELGGDYVSVNLNCLDDIDVNDPTAVKVVYWDGRHNNWEAGPRPAPWPVFPA